MELGHSSETVTSGGEVSTDSSTSFSVNGGGQGFDKTTTTTTAATYEQVITTCTALNPQGKVSVDNSTTVPGELVEIAPASSTTEESSVKVCGSGKGYTACPTP